MIGNAKSGWFYRVRLVDPRGRALSTEVVENLIPEEGIDKMQNILFKGAAAPTNFYVGLYRDAYTPTGDVKASTLSQYTSEFIDYNSGARPEFTPGSPAGGIVLADGGEEIEFELNDSGTIYGGFVSTSATKGGSGGVLWSIARFNTPKPATPDLKLLVTVGFQLIS